MRLENFLLPHRKLLTKISFVRLIAKEKSYILAVQNHIILPYAASYNILIKRILWGNQWDYFVRRISLSSGIKPFMVIGLTEL